MFDIPVISVFTEITGMVDLSQGALGGFIGVKVSGSLRSSFGASK
jgi:hypothetical protein